MNIEPATLRGEIYEQVDATRELYQGKEIDRLTKIRKDLPSKLLPFELIDAALLGKSVSS